MSILDSIAEGTGIGLDAASLLFILFVAYLTVRERFKPKPAGKPRVHYVPPAEDDNPQIHKGYN